MLSALNANMHEPYGNWTQLSYSKPELHHTFVSILPDIREPSSPEEAILTVTVVTCSYFRLENIPLGGGTKRIPLD